MSQSEFDQDNLVQSVRDTLDEQVGDLDELTRARLRAARYRALEHIEQQQAPWWSSLWSRWSVAAAGATCAVLLAWQLQAPAPGEGARQAEDAALIADLDLVLWLEDGGV